MTPVFIWERNFSMHDQILVSLKAKSCSGKKQKQKTEIPKIFLSSKRDNVFYAGGGIISSENMHKALDSCSEE